MEEKELIEALNDFGLTDKEVRVYLANLRIGSSKVNDISKQAKILRETTYFILKSLIEKGLVGYSIQSGIKYFESTSPNKFLDILKEKENKIQNILPSLLSLEKSVTEKPKVEIYEGKAGLKSILDQVINDKPKEILQLSSVDIVRLLQFYFPHWINRRVKNKINARILNQKTIEMLKYQKEGEKALREVKFLPKDFKINTTNFIWNNKIAIMTTREGEMIGVIIENKDIVDTEKSQFEFLWKHIK